MKMCVCAHRDAKIYEFEFSFVYFHTPKFFILYALLNQHECFKHNASLASYYFSTCIREILSSSSSRLPSSCSHVVITTILSCALVFFPTLVKEISPFTSCARFLQRHLLGAGKTAMKHEWCTSKLRRTKRPCNNTHQCCSLYELMLQSQFIFTKKKLYVCLSSKTIFTLCVPAPNQLLPFPPIMLQFHDFLQI